MKKGIPEKKSDELADLRDHSNFGLPLSVFIPDLLTIPSSVNGTELAQLILCCTLLMRTELRLTYLFNVVRTNLKLTQKNGELHAFYWSFYIGFLKSCHKPLI